MTRLHNRNYVNNATKLQVLHITPQSLHYIRTPPFIDKDFFERFNDILRDIKLQLFHYQSFYVAEDAAETKRECKNVFDECSKRTNEIDDRMKNLCADLREYLKTLDVVDEK